MSWSNLESFNVNTTVNNNSFLLVKKKLLFVELRNYFQTNIANTCEINKSREQYQSYSQNINKIFINNNNLIII